MSSKRKEGKGKWSHIITSLETTTSINQPRKQIALALSQISYRIDLKWCATKTIHKIPIFFSSYSNLVDLFGPINIYLK